jgi:hypothetical protein
MMITTMIAFSSISTSAAMGGEHWLAASSVQTDDDNPNCVARGKCITVGPGTKYPEQNTLCLGDSSNRPDSAGTWHCAATGGHWGAMDHTFGPGATFDITMMGGSPIHPQPGFPSENETFTVHQTTQTTYGKCQPTGPVQWTITRELSYLDGTADGQCMTRVLESGLVLGEFLHNCTVLTQIDIVADSSGKARAGCRCCNSCDPASACLPP